MDLPAESNGFIEFVQYDLIDFILNLLKPGSINEKSDECSIFCEVYIPIFKAFGNCLGVLNSTWYLTGAVEDQGTGRFNQHFKLSTYRCEKKTKDADYVWLVSNDFSKEKKDNLKLLDGVGTLAKTDSTYLVMESSGYSNDKHLSFV